MLRAVSDRIAEQVREHLDQPLRITGRHAFAGAVDLDRPIWMRGAELVDGALDQLLDVEVDPRAHEPDTTAEPDARQIEQVVDDRRHSLTGSIQPGHRELRPIVGRRSSRAAAPGHDRAQRVSQVVADAATNVSFSRSVSASCCRWRVELEEDVRLVRRMRGIDRLEEEVDGARVVALEHAVRLARAGGDEDDRARAACARCRASARRARSRPSPASARRGARARRRARAGARALRGPSAPSGSRGRRAAAAPRARRGSPRDRRRAGI